MRPLRSRAAERGSSSGKSYRADLTAPYRIEVKPAAVHDLRRIPAADINRIARKIDTLAETPHPPGASKIRGSDDGIWRLRVGDYHILYQIQQREKIVMIARIRHRREVYRKKS